ncbi:hypothetical protein HK100_001142 [Physocladia obscura]|uniref:Uncharacterized protein n=1 Tax=Physocladia obscura TaxID=109957 RepID=A0AAD5XF27_9FUNG|nr:hypothetical protein HK100_001142 [Physocladia obscura]
MSKLNAILQQLIEIRDDQVAQHEKWCEQLENVRIAQETVTDESLAQMADATRARTIAMIEQTLMQMKEFCGDGAHTETGSGGLGLGARIAGVVRLVTAGNRRAARVQLSLLPAEIVERVLWWAVEPHGLFGGGGHPLEEAVRLAALCRRVRAAAVSPAFSRAVVTRAVAPEELLEHLKRPRQMNRNDLRWFKWPAHLQEAYATLRMRTLDTVYVRHVDFLAYASNDTDVKSLAPISIPPAIGNATKLIDLYIFYCDATGGIPFEISNLENLKRLNLSNNRLSGPIPWQLGLLKNLTLVDLEHNLFSGAHIPAEFSMLVNLASLNLSNCGFCGEIPPTFGRLKSLCELDLSWNNLEGRIPAELGNCTNLTELNLACNQLVGKIPVSIAKLRNLVGLFLRCNKLHGSIPVQFSYLCKIRYLSVAFNSAMCGKVPKKLKNKSKFEMNANGTCISGSPLLLDTYWDK